MKSAWSKQEKRIEVDEMGQITDILKVDHGGEYALVINVKTTPREFSSILQQSRKEIREYLKSIGEMPSGVSFVGFYIWDDKTIEAIVGYPVKNRIQGKGLLKLFEIPPGLRVFAFHQGPYDSMGETYNKLEQWVADNGYKIVLPAYEYFYNSPKFPQELLLTKIEMVIAASESDV